MKSTGAGARGVRERFMRASSSRRSPLARLQGAQAVTTFSHVESPPRERGTTWSSVSRPPDVPQYDAAPAVAGEQHPARDAALDGSWHAHVLEEPDHERPHERPFSRAQRVVGPLHHLGLALPHEDVRPAHRAHVQRLVARVQDEYLGQRAVSVPTRNTVPRPIAVDVATTPQEQCPGDPEARSRRPRRDRCAHRPDGDIRGRAGDDRAHLDHDVEHRHRQGAKGPSRGDRYVTTSRLVNAKRQFGAKKGTVVGSDRGTITLTGPRSARVNGVATLPGGTIRVRGPLDEQTNATLVVPVVGGTGAFAGARGTLTINGTEKRAWNVYRLTYRLACAANPRSGTRP